MMKRRPSNIPGHQGQGRRPLTPTHLPIQSQYGFSTRTLTPKHAQESGVTGYRWQRPEPKRKVVEPIIDIFDEGDIIQVIAEMPGIDEKKINLNLWRFTLIISASDKWKAYRGEVQLPCEAKLGKQRLHNGILELTLKKAEGYG